MIAKLVVLDGKYQGREFVVRGPQFVIGRSSGCQLRANDGLLSRKHCVVLVDGDKVHVRDLGSSNGTYLDGKEVETERAIEDGAILELGNLRFAITISQFETAESAASGEPDDMIADWLTDDSSEMPKFTSGSTTMELPAVRDDDIDSVTPVAVSEDEAVDDRALYGDDDSNDDIPDSLDPKEVDPPAPAATPVHRPSSTSAVASDAASDIIKQYRKARKKKRNQ